MKASHHFASSIVALATLALCSCGSPVERRIKRNPGVFEKLSEPDKAAVRGSRIREGMDKSAVFLAWGAPARITEGKKNGKDYERWTYVEFDAVISQGYGPPYAYHHGHGGYYDVYDPLYYARPMVDYVPHDAAFVEFVGGKVTGFATPRR